MAFFWPRYNGATECTMALNSQGANVYVTVNALRPEMPDDRAAKDANAIAGIFQVADFEDPSGAGTARSMQAFGRDAFAIVTGTIPQERLHL